MIVSTFQDFTLGFLKRYLPPVPIVSFPHYLTGDTEGAPPPTPAP